MNQQCGGLPFFKYFNPPKTTRITFLLLGLLQTFMQLSEFLEPEREGESQCTLVPLCQCALKSCFAPPQALLLTWASSTLFRLFNPLPRISCLTKLRRERGAMAPPRFKKFLPPYRIFYEKVKTIRKILLIKPLKKMALPLLVTLTPHHESHTGLDWLCLLHWWQSSCLLQTLEAIFLPKYDLV